MTKRWVVKGLRGGVGLQEKLDKIEHRRDVQGPCTCGNPESGRCDVCRGPACSTFGEDYLCCDCLGGVLT